MNDNIQPGSPSTLRAVEHPTVRRRRVRMTRETGQSLVLSSLAGPGAHTDLQPVEIRISEVCKNGVAIVDVLLPDHMFVERKETLDSVHALFAVRPTPCPDPID